MEDFKIIQPSPLLAPFVKNYWLLKTATESSELTRTVLTGMMSLIFHRGNLLLSIHNNELQPSAFLGGHD